MSPPRCSFSPTRTHCSALARRGRDWDLAGRLFARHMLTVCEIPFVALAARLKVDLLTADACLANALAAHVPVKWLGSVTTYH